MNTVKKQIAEIIRKRRIEMNMTQAQVSGLLGYDNCQFLSTIERGLSKCPVQTLGALSIILNIPQERFISILLTDYKNQLIDSLNAGSKMIKSARKTG
ncbi:MAG: helix-turn-helix transcriptional regulator [Bdellovibrionaceae bacterium]|nr:helix-turn-helix transcriptional regulator [Pseudobdellovibrionaceae bacterium]